MRKYLAIFSLLLISSIPTRVWAASPSSTNYVLQSYGFGSGSLTNGSSTTYKLNGTAGEIEFGKGSSVNFQAGAGLVYIEQANLPAAPTVSNNNNTYYNKLQVILNTGNSSSDTQFAIQVTSSGTQYVQTDNTLGTNPVWQTNALWGSSGFLILGLTPGTSYTVKVAARQGSFTQTGFGPGTTVSTAAPTLSFSLSSNAVTLSQINPNTVVTSPNVTVTVSTNGTAGTTIYGYDNNNGLLSQSTSATIPSASTDLGSVAGYGLQTTSVSQTSGGPMESISPYNGASDSVGELSANKAIVFDSSNAPITNGQGVFVLKAKATDTTRAASDYADIVTVIAAATF